MYVNYFEVSINAPFIWLHKIKCNGAFNKKSFILNGRPMVGNISLESKQT